LGWDINILEVVMKIVYAVAEIEVESGWGSRPAGYRLYLDKNKCIRDTKKGSREGPGDGEYIGPVRPLSYVEIPWDSLPKNLQKKLSKAGVVGTEDFWEPKFLGARHNVKE
jgi:hypothetical protein